MDFKLERKDMTTGLEGRGRRRKRGQPRIDRRRLVLRHGATEVHQQLEERGRPGLAGGREVSPTHAAST